MKDQISLGGDGVNIPDPARPHSQIEQRRRKPWRDGTVRHIWKHMAQSEEEEKT
jgi:hypothetical protein